MELKPLIDKLQEERKAEIESKLSKIDGNAADIINDRPNDIVLLSFDDERENFGTLHAKFMAYNGEQFEITFWPASGMAQLSIMSINYQTRTPEQFWTNRRVLDGIWLQIGGV